MDGSIVELAQLMKFCNNEQERVKEVGVDVGDAKLNRKKLPAFFFGANASVVRPFPCPLPRPSLPTSAWGKIG